MRNSNDKKGVSLPGAPVSGPRAERMRDKKWKVFSVGEHKKTWGPGIQGPGGVTTDIYRIGDVSAPDYGEALNRARNQYGAESVDYLEPRGHFDRKKTGGEKY